MLASRAFALAWQATAVSQPADTFSQSTAHHAIAPQTHGPFDVTLVVLGVIVVVVTTIYTLLYLWRPGEASADHIKRRILEDRREGSR